MLTQLKWCWLLVNADLHSAAYTTATDTVSGSPWKLLLIDQQRDQMTFDIHFNVPIHPL